jgi:hypothetical protein
MRFERLTVRIRRSECPDPVNALHKHILTDWRSGSRRGFVLRFYRCLGAGFVDTQAVTEFNAVLTAARQDRELFDAVWPDLKALTSRFARVCPTCRDTLEWIEQNPIPFSQLR